jgi:hypothetical protein
VYEKPLQVSHFRVFPYAEGGRGGPFVARRSRSGWKLCQKRLERSPLGVCWMAARNPEWEFRFGCLIRAGANSLIQGVLI